MAKKTKMPRTGAPAITAALAAAPVPAATTPPAPFRVFYSWQSDLPNNRNRGCLKDALEKASKEFKKKTGVEMIVDEATRDTTGAVHIAGTILDKIKEADYFVADMSAVAANDKRKLPNPNVCIELGYAVAELGWERTGLAVNLAYGAIADLPFDIEKRRARGYTSGNSSSDEDRQNAKKALVSAFVADAEGIWRDNPLKARLQRETDLERVKRDRDIKNLELLLGQMSHCAMDYFLENAHLQFITQSIFHFQAGVNGVAGSSSFHLNDKMLVKKVRAFVKALNANLDFGLYTVMTNSDKLRFANEREDPSGRVDAALDAFARCTSRTERSWNALLDYVRKSYPEIDLDVLSRQAHREYVEFIREHGRG